MRSTFAVAAGLAAVAAASKPVTSTVTVDVTVTSCDETHSACPYGPTPTDGSWDDWSSTSTTTAGCGPTTTVTTVTGTATNSKVYSYTKTVTIDTCTTTTKDAVSSSSTGYTWADWTSTSSIPVDPVPTGSDYTWADWSSSTTTTSSTPVEATGCGVAPTAPPAWISLLPADKSASISAKWTGTVGPADWCYWTYSASISTSATPVAPVPTGGSWSSTGSPIVAPYGGTSATGVSPATYTGAASSNAGSFALAGLAAAAVMVIA